MNPNLRWGIVGGVPLVIIVAVFMLLIKPTMDDTDAVNTEYATIHKDVQAKEELERKLPEFIKQIADLEAQVTELRKQLPEKKEIPDLLDNVSGLGLQSGLEFQVFKPGAEVEKDFYAEVPVDMTVTGPFHALVDFFDRVSKMPRIVTFTSVNITKGSVKKGKTTGSAVGPAVKGTQITAVCKAVTFRFLEAKVDKTAPASAPAGNK